MPAPTKYTTERADRICGHLRKGSTRKAAYLSGGISEETFYEWLRRYPGFSGQVTRAEADCEAAMAACIHSAAPMDWRAAEAWLKRRRKEDWSEKVEQEHSGSVSIENVINALPAEFREAVRAELGGLVRAGEGSKNGKGS